MTKSALNPVQRQTVELIENMRFGVIERLSIRGGLPCYEPEPRVVQTVKLDSELDQKRDDSDGDLTLKKQFENLFVQLQRVQDGLVDIEVRHGLPFILVLGRHVGVSRQ